MDAKRNWTSIAARSLIGFAESDSLRLAGAPAKRRRSAFQDEVSVCHGADGKGDTAVGKADNVRDLGSADVQKQSDADLSAVITNGKDKMPAYGKSLKPDQVKDLVAYIRSLAAK